MSDPFEARIEELLDEALSAAEDSMTEYDCGNLKASRVSDQRVRKNRAAILASIRELREAAAAYRRSHLIYCEQYDAGCLECGPVMDAGKRLDAALHAQGEADATTEATEREETT